MDGHKDVFGRSYTTVSESYELPVDEEEHDRLTIQHRIWKLCVGGLYPPDIQIDITVLFSSNSINQPMIADIGSGSGAWAIEMAQMYPQAAVVGLDLASPGPKDIPSNCSFKVVDATKGLDEYANHFDVVHCRAVLSHIIDRAAFMHILAKILKPGGILIIGDGNKHMFSAEKELVFPVDTSGNVDNTGRSWFLLWGGTAVKHIMKKIPNDPDYLPIESWIREEGKLEFLGKRTYFGPINWDGGDIPDGEELGRLGSQNMQAFISSTKPVLQSLGIPEDTLAEWHEKAMAELQYSGTPLKMTAKWDMFWAKKRA